MNCNWQTLFGIYALAIGYGTEAGATPYQLTVARSGTTSNGLAPGILMIAQQALV